MKVEHKPQNPEQKGRGDAGGWTETGILDISAQLIEKNREAYEKLAQ